jgi:cytochrome c-type biogenesis protein CcmF
LALFGFQALNIALVVSAFATIVYFFNPRLRSPQLLCSAHRAVYAVFILVTFSSFSLFYAFFTRNFQIEYVAEYSNRALSWFYTATAFWAGQAGSLLLWAWLLITCALIVLLQNKNRNRVLMPYAMGVINLTMFFFLYLLVYKSNPFEQTDFIPTDGNGLNPLLQNPEMIFHPPSLYVGFVGFTIPFAFAIAALISRQLDDQWIKSIRRWTLFSWLFLTIGNVLGMQWAYVELGWGGYWAWDPVENASLLPWLTATAFLHSIVVQERKDMLKIWNMSLIVITFALTIFGTFVTRSGLISSVHAFGVSTMGPLFLGFLAIILVGSAILLFSRATMLRNEYKIDSWTSKESSFMLNNLFFLIIMLGVLLGTVLPSLTELYKGEKISVGAEYFNRFVTPIAMAIFLLLGICSLLSWRKTPLRTLAAKLMIPGIAAMLAVIFIVLIGLKGFVPVFALTIAVFTLVLVIQNYSRGITARQRKGNLPWLRAVAEQAMQYRRRNGATIVHIGVLFLFIGIIGSSGFGTRKDATVKKGDQIEIGSYRLVFEGIESSHSDEIHIDAALFQLYKNGRQLGSLQSEKHTHANFQPATEVGIRSTLQEDIYLVLASYDRAAQTATVQVLINPLTLWMWIGGIVMVIGTLVALLPGAAGDKLSQSDE